MHDMRPGWMSGYWESITGFLIPPRSHIGSLHKDSQYIKFHSIVVQVASVNTYDGAIVDAETIRLGLGWGCSLAVGPYC